MWFSVSGIWLAVGGVGVFLAGALTIVAAYLVFRAAVNAAAQQVSDKHAAQQAAETAQRETAAKQAELAAITPQLIRQNGELHTKAHWGAVEVSEQLTGILVEVVRDGEVMRARLENALLRAEWVRNGGNPEANWVDIVKWKNAKESK